MRIDITCSTDDNYVQHCMAMLCSVYHNNSEHKVYTHLLHNGLSSESISLFQNLNARYNNSILFYSIDEEKIKDVKLKVNSPVTIATYYRLLLPELLSESIDLILYLDCDVIVRKDISELFSDIDMSDYGVAAVKDSLPWNTKHRFVMGLSLDESSFCAGVMLINLKYWREHNCKQRLIDFSTKDIDEVFFADQDALNYVFRKHWYQLPYQYGHSPLSIAILDRGQRWSDYWANAYDPSIIHYAAHIKPWFKVKFPESNLYWHYLELSDYPNPRIIPASSDVIRSIKSLKYKYYISKYIRPLIPNLIEIIINDLINIVQFTTSINSKKKIKSFLLRRWLSKYNH